MTLTSGEARGDHGIRAGTSSAAAPSDAAVPSDRHGSVPFLLRAAAFSIFFFPSSMVVDGFGAAGTVPMILGCLLLGFWVASSAWGLHRPLTMRFPGRAAGALFFLAVGGSYIALHGGWITRTDEVGLAAADRWMILVAASLGFILVAGETVRTMADALQLTRWILGGAFFCTLVGAVQLFTHVNPMEWFNALMPGFTDNGGDTPFQQRGNLMRVAGSTFHSIEYAVVSAMLLPLSIWRALHDPVGRRWFHWVQTAFLVFAIASTVSRSGTLGAAVALVVFVPFLPRVAKRAALIVLPLVIVTLFVTFPGFLGTLTSALTANASDPSIATRTNNYPRVMRIVDENPWFGLGPGNYRAENALQILDNQYLNAAVSIGLVGLALLVVYLWLPAISTVFAARAARSPALRSLAGATAGGLAVGAVCSATFDSLSFPVFALVYPLLVGLSGGVWRMVQNEPRLLGRRTPLTSGHSGE
ncbi:O-antigen ligase family protein [Microbacterium caowuchunii]|uniref:O-antigen ligase family protein n=1 Tax=Microbacterium caowuchunii TaxID=2614638 RepID=A0A5N0TQ58_9MICO|nr:O-antigen ligase family protein [Microbacterium caowuchunii]KAA9135529.1 O-antigen ligase family protein [Microbacterium caowuchunii]